MSEHLEITVWDLSDGSVMAKVWDGSWEDYDALVGEYDDGPYEVVIDREWIEDDEPNV